MWPCTSTNGLPWPDSASRAPELVDHVQGVQELADRIRRPAVVEIQRDAPEQVVPGDQKPPLGLEQADVRRGVARASRTPSRCPDRFRSRRRPPAAGRARSPARFPRPCRGRARRIAGAPLRARPLWRPISSRRASASSGSVAVAKPCAVVGVKPELASGPVADRRRLPPVVDMGVGANEQPHVFDAQARPGPTPARARPSTPARACPCRPAPRRRRPRSPTRCSAARPAAAAAGAIATGRVSPALRGRAHLCVAWPRTIFAAHLEGDHLDSAPACPAERSPRGTSRRSPRTTSTPRSRCWAPGGVERVVGQREMTAPADIRTSSWASCSARSRTCVTSCSRSPPARTARPFAGAPAARSRGPSAFQGFVPNGARLDDRGLRRPRPSHGETDRRTSTPISTAATWRASSGCSRRRARRAESPPDQRSPTPAPARARGSTAIRAGANRRGRVARARRLPEDDERVPDRGRRRRHRVRLRRRRT